MQDTIHLNYKELTAIEKQIIASSFPDYKGRTIKVTPSTHFNPNENSWSGGSRTYQVVLSRAGQKFTVPTTGNAFVGATVNLVEIPKDTIVVQHEYFCGKDLGIEILVRPDEMPQLISAPKSDDLTKEEKIVLFYTRSRVSSYNGMNRMQMAINDRMPITEAQWNSSVEVLISKGLLAKNKSITPNGRNASKDITSEFQFKS